MNNNPSQPREYDSEALATLGASTVLGGHAPPPLDGAVLGGLEGVKNRLKSTVARERVASMFLPTNYLHR